MSRRGVFRNEKRKHANKEKFSFEKDFYRLEFNRYFIIDIGTPKAYEIFKKHVTESRSQE